MKFQRVTSSQYCFPHFIPSFKILKGILSAYSPNPSGRHPRLCIVCITLWTSFESTCGVPMRWGLCTSIYMQISCKNQLLVHSNSKPKALSSSQFKTYVCPSRSITDLMASRPFFLLFLSRNLSIFIEWMNMLVTFNLTEYQYYPALLCFASVLNTPKDNSSQMVRAMFL